MSIIPEDIIDSPPLNSGDPLFKNLKRNFIKITEAEWHPLIQSSFLFVPRASQRMSSDDLIIELYREVFFERRYGSGSLKRLNPEELKDESSVFSDEEKYSLYMSRGREKQDKAGELTDFYAPMYPSLARSSWFRPSMERCVRDFFLRIITQHLHGYGENKKSREQDFVNKFYNALHGKIDKNESKSDIAGLDVDELNGCLTEEEGRKRLSDLCSLYGGVESSENQHKSIFTLQDNQPDELAETIFEDLMYLCKLEGDLDRLQWMSLLKTFLRFSSSVWLLAQMRMTIILRDKLLSIMANPEIKNIDDACVDRIIKTRYKKLLKPKTTLSKNEIEKYVQDYVNARIELNVLVALVEKYTDSVDWSNKKTITLHDGSADELSVVNLMAAGQEAGKKEDFLNDLEGLELGVKLIRHCERYKSWKIIPDPKKQPVKGYCEFLLVLRKYSKGRGEDDDGYLICPSPKRNAGYTIFPGNLMLKLVTYLATRGDLRRGLILSDVENHFIKYGLDFGEIGKSREKFIASLQDMGLLKGSPDAGDSVRVENPYKENKKVAS